MIGVDDTNETGNIAFPAKATAAARDLGEVSLQCTVRYTASICPMMLA